MARSFRPYEVIPGYPIEIVVAGEDGGRVQINGTVEKVPTTAGNAVIELVVSGARFTPLPAEG